MGMPAADRPWSPADYAQAQRVLTELAAGDATRLPRAESRTSPEMFARIVDPANLELAESLGSDPLQKFASIGMNLHAPVNEILKIYIAAASKAGYFDREQVDLFLLTQAIGVRLWKYADLFFAGLSPDDPTYPARMQGLGQMRDGLALVVSGSLTTLTEKHAYRRDVLLRFAAGMKAYLPDLVERLGPQSRLEVPARLEQMARAETDPELRKAIEELRSALRPAGE